MDGTLIRDVVCAHWDVDKHATLWLGVSVDNSYGHLNPISNDCKSHEVKFVDGSCPRAYNARAHCSVLVIAVAVSRPKLPCCWLCLGSAYIKLHDVTAKCGHGE
jgi:hypothetical protein